MSFQQNTQKVSQQTQTDLSLFNMQEKLQRKEIEIMHLASKLKFYKQKLESLQQTIQQSLKASPSLSNLSDDSVKLRTSTPNYSSNDWPRGSKILRNTPLDTFAIQEFPRLTPSSNTVKLKESSPTDEKNGFMSMIRKKSSRVKRVLDSQLQTSNKKPKSKSNKKLNGSLINDMLYQDGQNRQSWNDLLGQFRKDPGLMKFMLDKNDRYYCYFDLGPNKRNISSKGKRVISQDSKSRPKTIKSGSRSIQLDWSHSEIDSQVIKGIFSFQSDSSCYSSNQIEELIESKDFSNFDQIYNKANETLDRLKSELMLPKSFWFPTIKTQEGLEQLLVNCLKLFKSRAIIVKLLRTLHTREDTMLKLMSGDEFSAVSTYSSIHLMNQELIQLIAYLQHSRFPVTKFVYLGEDLHEKILRDNLKLKSLYPILQESEEQEEGI